MIIKRHNIFERILLAIMVLLTGIPVQALGMENEDYTSEYGYDKNSNLLWAYRQGVVDDVEEGLYYDTMDDYNAYYRGNQKLTVGGTGVGEPSYYGSSSFVDGADEEVEYAYNANGSMTMDLNKGITNIAYDLLGNLKEITFDNNRIIRYVYTADGTRLRTVHLQKKNGVWLKDSTDYYGNLLLKNGAINKYLFSGGYLSFSSGTANGCHYYIQDYQGSNRMVVNSSGATEQITHYYPYGGVIGGIDLGSNLQPYKFEGKELDRTYGLDWYDIHARQYDPIVPAWHTIDPQAEKSYHISPYVYCAGDPVNRVDRNGELPDFLWDLFNIGLGIQSFTENIQSGNYWDATVDAGGILVDAAAAIVPVVPGGVGAGIKAARGSAIEKQVIKFAGRSDTNSSTAREAFRKAKDQNGIPRSQQPDKIVKPNTPEGQNAGLTNKNVKLYQFTNSKGEKVNIRQDKAVKYDKDGGNQSRHFNAGLEDEKLKQHHNYEDWDY